MNFFICYIFTFKLQHWFQKFFHQWKAIVSASEVGYFDRVERWQKLVSIYE